MKGSEQIAKLSTRQREVLLLISLGLSTRQIAGRLGVSHKTIEAHKEHIKSKLTLHSAAELSHFARAWKMGVAQEF